MKHHLPFFVIKNINSSFPSAYLFSIGPAIPSRVGAATYPVFSCCLAVILRSSWLSPETLKLPSASKTFLRAKWLFHLCTTAWAWIHFWWLALPSFMTICHQRNQTTNNSVFSCWSTQSIKLITFCSSCNNHNHWPQQEKSENLAQNYLQISIRVFSCLCRDGKPLKVWLPAGLFQHPWGQTEGNLQLNCPKSATEAAESEGSSSGPLNAAAPSAKNKKAHWPSSPVRWKVILQSHMETDGNVPQRFNGLHSETHHQHFISLKKSTSLFTYRHFVSIIMLFFLNLQFWEWTWALYDI